MKCPTAGVFAGDGDVDFGVDVGFAGAAFGAAPAAGGGLVPARVTVAEWAEALFPSEANDGSMPGAGGSFALTRSHVIEALVLVVGFLEGVIP